LENITIEGMRKLFLLKRDGKKLPDNWKELVGKYLEIKSIEAEKHKLCCSDCRVKQQYAEARNIALYLGEMEDNEK